VAAVVGAGLPVACASNSGRVELFAKLETLGLATTFAGRAFSYQDVAQGKPAPDLYRLAAQACGAAPEHCVVVEDSVLGAKAGLAAGCRVLGLVHEFDASVFLGMGVTPLRHMDDLAAALGLE
jgi:beta-phosphoglucomutase-like phosphatase (HAD superfamily)